MNRNDCNMWDFSVSIEDTATDVSFELPQELTNTKPAFGFSWQMEIDFFDLCQNIFGGYLVCDKKLLIPRRASLVTRAAVNMFRALKDETNKASVIPVLEITARKTETFIGRYRSFIFPKF